MIGYGNSMFLATHGILARGASGAAVDPDAQAFITAASITDPTQQGAINTLVVDLKAYSIWTKFKAIYPIVGGSASSHKWNLKDPRDLDAAFRLTFTTGWTHSSTGMIGLNAYSDTKLNVLSNLLQNSTHISAYIRTNNTSNNAVIAGSRAVTPSLNIFPNLSGSSYFRVNSNTDGGVSTGGSHLGLWIANRITSTETRNYRNTTRYVNATASTGLINQPIYIASSPDFADYYLNQIAFASIGDGLTDTEAANFYTAIQAFQTTLGRSIGTQTVSDADAQAFVTAANITDQVEANAVNNLVIGMKADGLWTKMKAIYPIVGGVASSHAVNLKTPGTFNLTFSSGWTHSSTGMTPTNAYADTALNTSTQLNVNSHSFGMYSRTNNTTGSQAIGSFDNTPRFLQNNLSLGNFVSGLVSSIISYTANPSTSLLMLTRTSSTLSKAFRAGVLLGQETVAMGTLPTFNFYLGARNDAGSAAVYSVHQCAFAFIGDGLTDTEATNYYNRVQAYQTTLNRQV